MSESWLSTVVSGEIHQYLNDELMCRMITIDGTKGSWNWRPCRDINEARFCPASCFVPSCNKVLMSGGEGLRSTSVHDLALDKWIDLGIEMKEIRRSHSSCLVGQFVYVIAGCNFDDEKWLSSVERLSVSAVASSSPPSSATW